MLPCIFFFQTRTASGAFLSHRAARLKLDVASSVAQLALVSLRLNRCRAA